LSNQHEYWASRPLEAIAAEVEGKFDEYLSTIDQTGYLHKIRKFYGQYYGVNEKGAFEVEKSDDGAVKFVKVNHYKSLIKRIHILITQNKLAFQVRARNSDVKSQLEADLGKGILEYYNDEKALSKRFSEAVETSLVCLEAFMHCPWARHKGEEIAADMETGEMVYTGDQEFEVKTALDVARNIRSVDSDWYIVRCQQNKWDLAALYPEFADEITSASCDYTYRLNVDTGNMDDDQVDVLYFYHRKTPAMKQGRYSVICNGQALADSPLPYKRPPVFRLTAGNVVDSIYGDSPAADIASIQEVVDALYSAVCTNNINFAQQNIWSQDSNLSVSKISEGQNLIVSATEPKALQLTQSAAETYKLLDKLENSQQLLSGVNATARGTPEASLKSGNSLALMLAQAIQYVNDLQNNFAQLGSDVGTCVINNIQSFAKGEMLVVIGGQSRKSYIRNFQAKELINIDRVSVDLGNPLTQTYAGRYELVQQWMQFGIANPKTIVEFLKTGQVDSLIDGEFADLTLVQEENEMLKRGEQPPMIRTDDHPYHIEQHRQLLSDPEARYNPELVTSILNHISEHEMAMQPPMPPPGPPGPGGQPEQMPPDDPNAQLGPGQSANLPNPPPGAPPEVAADFEQATAPQQGMIP
jgi:hypothetical protein